MLKARQIGISTCVAARFYWLGTHRRGQRTYILAHLDQASDNLYSIARRMHDNCPELLKPATGAANAKELSFSALDGGYRVATAGSRTAGRSETIQLMHASEVAFWNDADELFSGVMQGLAKGAGSEAVLESTANGPSGTFYDLWKAAEAGDSEFIPIFLPWWLHEEYVAEPPADWRPPAKFAEYAELHGLTPEQLYWAWNENRTLAQATNGNTDEPCWKFKQEFPAIAAEAFASSGEESFIPALSVLKARKATGIRPWGPVIIGCDPARGGRDKTAIIDRQGRVMGRHVCRKLNYGHDTMPISGEIVRAYRDLTARGESVFVVFDVTGLGGPLYDRVREILPTGRVYGVNFGSQPLDPNRFANCRAEIWNHMADWFNDPGGVSCPDLDDLQGDICAPSRGKGATRFDSAGRLILESKDHIKERVNFSPDFGDAAALTFAIDMGVLLEREDDDEEDAMNTYAQFTRSPVTGY